MLPAAAIAQELQFGNEVDGLIDLPVRDIIDRLKTEFPGATERAGLLTVKVGGGSLEASWSWQFVKVEFQDLSEETRQQVCDIMQDFSATAYDPQLNLRHPH